MKNFYQQPYQIRKLFCLLWPLTKGGYAKDRVVSSDRSPFELATFIRQKVSISVGGGLCQLFGVLYNLALLSGCRILERHPHSIDAYGEDRYIPLGRDATITYPWKDICFQNPYKIPLRLSLDIKPERAYGWIHSAEKINVKVDIDVSPAKIIPSPLTEIKDPSLPKGQTQTDVGFDGKEVQTHRKIQLENQPFIEEILSRDSYRTTPTIVRSGEGD